MAISKALVKKLPKEQQCEPAELASKLHASQAGRCSLCDGAIALADEGYEADHDVPEDDGGLTTIANLRLAHTSCNRAKRNADTGDIRPYLKLKRYLQEASGRPRYDGVLPHFGIQPKPVVAEVSGDVLMLHLPGQATPSKCAVFEDPTEAKTYRYTFVEVPRSALWNDDVVQPRSIKLDHAYSIFLDLHRNPLHEPPSCRIVADGTPSPLLMFDGQHKTVASWMAGRKSVVVKIYLDLDPNDAIRLVNSIQAKIKKLPLSAFELVGKMSDEFKGKMSDYEEAGYATESKLSEKGFIDWLPKDERTRARQALRAAIEQAVLDDEDLRLMRFVQLKGEKTGVIRENTVKTKILNKLLHTKATDDPLEESSQYRDREREIAVRLINQFVDVVLDLGDDATPADEIARQRLTYQASLSYVFHLIRQIYRHVMVQDTSEIPMQVLPTTDQWSQIEGAIGHLLGHPLWRIEGDTPMIKSALDAMSKNQGFAEVAAGVGLDLGYSITGQSQLVQSLVSEVQ